MNVLVLIGEHPRHLFFASALRRDFDIVGVVCMRREQQEPAPPASALPHDAENFVRHFADRSAAEKKYFGEIGVEEALSGLRVHYCTPETFNTDAVAAFALQSGADIACIFGTALIKEPLMSSLPADKINMHGGLSPWYRGTATHFWPFYNMQPQFCGSTLHQISPQVDAGAIIHQSVPVLERGDRIHDVACKTVIQTTADLCSLIRLRETGPFTETPQRSQGRIYRNKDFRPEHLRVIYDLFHNDMVDAYLRGELGSETPLLVNGLIHA